MKRLDTSAVTSSTAMPIKSGTLEFLQDANKETIANIVKSLLGFVPDVNTIYILSGCVNSNTAPTYNVSAGVVYYNGEIYEVAAFNFTTTGTQEAYPNLVVTQFTTNADPVQFTDGTPRNVHNIRNFVVNATDTATGIPSFGSWLKSGSWIIGDTKEVVCDSTYLSTNFDSTGLGRLERKGWAIMNGANGTPNDNGKVVIAYGTSYTTLGATGGTETQTLVKANLPNFIIPKKVTDGTSTDSGTLSCNFDLNTNDSIGSSTPFSVMQPYTVRLRIMKL